MYLLVVAALLAAVRIYVGIRRGRGAAHDDWDARLVQNLRAAGGNAFTPYEVDFFFSLPDEATCTALGDTLEPEGFAVDTRVMGGEGASGYLAARAQAPACLGERDAGLFEAFSRAGRAASAATTTAG